MGVKEAYEKVQKIKNILYDHYYWSEYQNKDGLYRGYKLAEEVLAVLEECPEVKEVEE